MTIIDKKVIFLTILYVVLLVMMLIYTGILIYQGEIQDKSIPFIFFGFSFIVSIICVICVLKSESKSGIVKFSMGLASLLLFSFLVAAITLAKPQSDKTIQFITYSNMTLFFLINIYATTMFIGKPIINYLPSQQQSYPV